MGTVVTYAGYDTALQHGEPLYFVPSETLSGTSAGPLVKYTMVEPYEVNPLGTAH